MILPPTCFNGTCTNGFISSKIGNRFAGFPLVHCWDRTVITLFFFVQFEYVRRKEGETGATDGSLPLPALCVLSWKSDENRSMFRKGRGAGKS